MNSLELKCHQLIPKLSQEWLAIVVGIMTEAAESAKPTIPTKECKILNKTIKLHEMEPFSIIPTLRPSDPRIIEIILEIWRMEHPMEANTKVLAGKTKLAYDSFRTLATRDTNMAPKTLIRFLSVERIKILLQKSKEQIINLAGSIGFNDISNFNREFKKQVGCSPREYRAQMIKNDQPLEVQSSTHGIHSPAQR
jgi:AraC-like DNA-binding protein